MKVLAEPSAVPIRYSQASRLTLASLVLLALGVGTAAGFLGGNLRQKSKVADQLLQVQDRTTSLAVDAERAKTESKNAVDAATKLVSERDALKLRSAKESNELKQKLLTTEQERQALAKQFEDVKQKYAQQILRNEALRERELNNVLKAVLTGGGVPPDDKAVAELAKFVDSPEFLNQVAFVRNGAKSAEVIDHCLQFGDLQKSMLLMQIVTANFTAEEYRFTLAVLRFFRSVERLMQTLHHHGLRPQNRFLPLFRLPLPENPRPTPITTADLRKALDQFVIDLAEVESSLAILKDDEIKVPMRLGLIRFDLNGDGKPDSGLLDLFRSILGVRAFQFDNDKLLVHFDRGDVFWLRSYCHLLSSFAEFYLTFDIDHLLPNWGETVFSNPPGGAKPTFNGVIKLSEPKRLASVRQHLLAVTRMNKETWKHILAEKDNDREWLPNPSQSSVLGLELRQNQIDTWLTMMAALEDLFEGRKGLNPRFFGTEFIPGLPADRGLHIKNLLDDPPNELDLATWQEKGVPMKYWKTGDKVGLEIFLNAFMSFDGPGGALLYMAWMN